jgi:hypothetical protein
MLPLRIVETDREDFDEPVVEIWRDSEFVGMVFWDGTAAIAQVYPDSDGDALDLDLGYLLQILELSERIVTPEDLYEDDDQVGPLGEPQSATWEGEDPATLALVEEFDPQVTHRAEEGEGFFSKDVAAAFIDRCAELGLAVVEMEGLDFVRGEIRQRLGLQMTTRVEKAMPWEIFSGAANTRAGEMLQTWTGDNLVVSFVVQEAGGDTFVA